MRPETAFTRIVSVLALVCLGLSAAAEAPPAPDGYADRLCTSPQSLTGALDLGANLGSASYPPDVVWDGLAYGVAYLDQGANVRFLRVAADGTALTTVATLDTSSVACYAPSIAWSGSEYGVAWFDGRNGNNEIYFARVSAAGALVAGSEIRLTNDTASSQAPSLAWCGTEWRVAWQDSRTTTGDIYAARISAAGAKVGADLQITNDPAASLYPALTWDGETCGVVWEDTRSTSRDIYFARVDEAGKVGSDVQLTSDAGSSYAPSLAWTGGVFGVAWHDSRTTGTDIYFARMASDGTLLGSEVQITSDAGYSYYPHLEWTGSEFGVAWFDTRGTDYDIYFARVSGAGAKVGGDVRLSFDQPAASRPRLAYGTLGYGLVFTDTFLDGTWFIGVGCRTDSTAPSCPTGLLETANSSQGVRLQWMAGVDYETEVAYHRVYRDSVPVATVAGTTFTDAPRPAGTLVYTVTAVNANGRESLGCGSVVVDPPEGECGLPQSGEAQVARSTATAWYSSLAWTGSEYGVAWQDNRLGNYELYFARMAADGTRLGTELCLTTSGSGAVTPSLVWTGSGYGLAWSDSRDGNSEVYFARLDSVGTKLGGDVRITTDGASSYLGPRGALAWTGTEFGITWYDNRDGNYEIYFARLSAAGAKIGADVRVTSASADSWQPSLAFSGAEYGLAWHDERDGNTEIYFARVSAAGVKQGSDVRLTNDTGVSSNPAIVWGPGEWGLVWYDQRDGYEIYFGRVSAGGVKQGSETRLTTSISAALYPVVAWTGSEYGVAWNDGRSGDPEIYYASVSAGVSDWSERRLTISVATEQWAALAAGGRGLGLVYRRDLAADEILFQSVGCGAADTTAPSTPGAPAETGRTIATVGLAWGPSTDGESDLGAYRVFRDGTLVGTTATTTWVDLAFDPAAGHVYWITATNAAGLESPASASLDTSDTELPTCAGALCGTRSGETITLNWAPAWDAKSGVKEYRVYRNGVLAGTVAAPMTTFGETPAAGSYAYTVETVDWAGNYTSTCPTYWVTTSPILLFVTKNGDAVNADLDWNDAGLPEYVVYRSTDAQAANALKTVPQSAAKDPVLKDGVALWFYFIQQRE